MKKENLESKMALMNWEEKNLALKIISTLYKSILAFLIKENFDGGGGGRLTIVITKLLPPHIHTHTHLWSIYEPASA